MKSSWRKAWSVAFTSVPLRFRMCEPLPCPVPQTHQDAQAQRMALERRQLDGTPSLIASLPPCLLSRLLTEGSLGSQMSATTCSR